MKTIEDMVRQEVVYCASALIHTLASGYSDARGEFADVAELALELSMPIDDWEESAIQDGWTLTAIEADRCLVFTHTDGRVNRNTTWGELCDEQDLEPYQREIFEHWIVSDWLADKLAAKGERVEKDFFGMAIWGRTTTGQGIVNDSVIGEIYADIERDYREAIGEIEPAPEPAAEPARDSDAVLADTLESGADDNYLWTNSVELADEIAELRRTMRTAARLLRNHT